MTEPLEQIARVMLEHITRQPKGQTVLSKPPAFQILEQRGFVVRVSDERWQVTRAGREWLRLTQLAEYRKELSEINRTIEPLGFSAPYKLKTRAARLTFLIAVAQKPK